MNPTLRDLIDHQLWADVEHWNAIASHAPAHEDKAIRDRLHHLHIVQRAFVWITGDRSTPFIMSTPEDFLSLETLREFARGSHEQIATRRDTITNAGLDERIEILWFKDPPLRITRAEALMQMAMHSQWHRGQNAARLRELGAEPPTVDLIVWWWKGRPSAAL
jgi:uncharacterized damage-inducible protein DinB